MITTYITEFQNIKRYITIYVSSGDHFSFKLLELNKRDCSLFNIFYRHRRLIKI